MDKKIIILSMIVGSLSACAPMYPVPQTPVPVNFSAESQYKLQAASHWNNVAVDMAESVGRKFENGKACILNRKCETISIRDISDKTAFSLVFRNQLISAMVNRGMSVVGSEQADIIGEFDVQLVRHVTRDFSAQFDYPLYDLKDGIWVIRDLNDTAVHQFKSLSSEYAVQGETNKLSWFYSDHAVPATEVVVTVSLMDSRTKQYVARTTNVYYLASDEHFFPANLSDNRVAPPAPNIRVVGDCPDKKCVQ